MSRLLIFLSIAVLLAPFAQVALADPPPRSDELLPADTLAFVTIPDVSQLREQWDRSTLGAIQQDPEFQEFWDEVQSRLQEMTGDVQQQFGVPLETIWDRAEGELSLALIDVPEQGISLVGTVDFGDEQEAAKLLQQTEARLAESGGEPSTVKAAGEDVTTISLGTGRSLAYVQRGSRVMWGDSLPGVLSVVAGTRNESSPRLASDPEYRKILEQTSLRGESPSLQWYANPVGFLEASIAANIRGNPQAPMILNGIRALGFDHLRGVGGTTQLGSGSFDTVSRTFGYIEQPTRGVLSLFRFPAVPQSPPDWVAADTALYYQVNWDIGHAYEGLAGLVDALYGEGTFDRIGEDAGGGFDLKADLIDQLKGPIHVTGDVPSENLTTQPAVIALEVKDPERLQELMARMVEGLEGSRQREIDGEQVHELEFPGPLPGQNLRMGLTVAEGTLMLTTDIGYLERTLKQRGEVQPLAESPAYQRVAEHFPERTSVISYQSQDGRMETLYELLRSGITAQLGGLVMSPLMDLDYTKLPPFSAARKYLQQTGSYIEPVESGFRSVTFALPPREGSVE